MSFRQWEVLDKQVKPHERGDGNYLTLIVTSDGKDRVEAVVSGATFHTAKVGDKLKLPGLDIDELRTKANG